MNSTALNKRSARDAGPPGGAGSVAMGRVLFQVALLVAAIGFLVLIS
jgi:hypothetical protein